MSDQVKFVLDEKDIPKTWYNLTADLPKPLPPVLHPGTKQPIGPADLEPLFPMELILQEVTGERYLDIPQPIRDVYRMWRPAPLIRARRLEQKLGTPAKIYFKYEGVSPAGSHKPNTAVAQAWYNKQAGVKRSEHRDRGRAVGFFARLRGCSVRHRRDRVPGARVVRSEALPASADGNLRRALHCVAVERDGKRSLNP